MNRHVSKEDIQLSNENMKICLISLATVVVQSLSHVQFLETPLDCSTPGFPVLHHCPELAQIHVHGVDDAIQLSCPLSSLYPPAFNLSQHELTLHIRWPKYWTFSFSISPSMYMQDLFPLGLTGWISLQPKGLSRIFSKTTVQKHKFFGPQLTLYSNSHIHA